MVCCCVDPDAPENQVSSTSDLVESTESSTGRGEEQSQQESVENLEPIFYENDYLFGNWTIDKQRSIDATWDLLPRYDVRRADLKVAVREMSRTMKLDFTVKDDRSFICNQTTPLDSRVFSGPRGTCGMADDYRVVFSQTHRGRKPERDILTGTVQRDVLTLSHVDPATGVAIVYVLNRSQ